ncbi:universal stress protein [Streptomyces cellulosae]
MTNRHVVVGVDGSLTAVRALDRAAVETLHRGTALRIVYAVADRDEAGPVPASAVARVHERHPELPEPVAAMSHGQELQVLIDRAEEAVPRFGIARRREEYPRARSTAVRSAPDRPTPCRQARARPASWSSAGAGTRAGSAHRSARR